MRKILNFEPFRNNPEEVVHIEMVESKEDIEKKRLTIESDKKAMGNKTHILVELNSENDWLSKPTKDGMYLMQDDKGRLSFEIVYAMEAEHPRVINEEKQSEPLNTYTNCKWYGPIEKSIKII